MKMKLVILLLTYVIAESMEKFANDFNEDWGIETLGDMETPGELTPLTPALTGDLAAAGDSVTGLTISSSTQQQ